MLFKSNIRKSQAKCISLRLVLHVSEVNGVVKGAGLRGRDIVWYVQLHFPWVCDFELSNAYA